MGSGYFWVEHDFPPSGRWYLGEVCDDRGQPIDTSVFFRASPLDLAPPARLPLLGGGTTDLTGPACIQVARPGPALAFTLGAFDLPVVSGRLAELMAPLVGDDVQRLPARIDGRNDPYEILNIVACLDCIDHDRSQIEWWTPPGGAPGAPHVPFAMYEMVVDPAAAEGHQILRPADWKSAVLVSAAVKEVLEKAGELGVRFTAV